jgi:hypothetical protein
MVKSGVAEALLRKKKCERYQTRVVSIKIILRMG